MTTALVTGASGFIGRHLVPVLRARGLGRVAGADLRAAPDAACDVWHALDLTDPRAVRELIAAERPAGVFHLVGEIRGADEAVRASNVESARAVLDAVRVAAPAARVVLVGSAAEYGTVPTSDQPVRESFEGAPHGAYGKAKREVSALTARYAREFGVHCSVARPSNVIGPGMSDALVVGAVVQRLRAALAGPPPRAMRIGATQSVRDFVAVEDVAEGMVRVSERGAAGEAYNLSSGEGHSVAEVLQHLLAFAQEPVEVRRDAALLRPGEVDAIVCSNEKALRELGWRPAIPFGRALRAAWDSAAAGIAA